MRRAAGQRRNRADRDDTATRGGTDPTGAGACLLRHGPLIAFLVAAAVRALYVAELAVSPLAGLVAGDGEAIESLQRALELEAAGEEARRLLAAARR